MISIRFQKRESSQNTACDKSNCLGAKIDVALYGTKEKPILVLKIKNIGVNPIKVDHELVFLVTIKIVGPNETPLELEEAKSIPVPDRKTLKKRFVQLQPGQSIQREIELTNSFKYFEYGIGTSDTVIMVTAYEVLCRLPGQADPKRIEIFYGPFYGFREGFAQYTGLESTDLGLFEGPLQTSIEWGRFGK